MRRLVVFNQVTLDGYFTGVNGDLSWAHRNDPEWNAFVEGNASSGSMLVFGRITYEMMASFWPTPLALQSNPIVAERMNKLPKLVFSRTLDKAAWSNTKLVDGDPVAEIRKIKQESGPDMTILGSGSIVSQLAPHGLIDEYQVVVCPVVLGRGRTMFEGIKETLAFMRTGARNFTNGNVLLRYEPMR
jgi:dihydrofolate reductase